ncbi:MAG: metallophosphoesterase, partial [Oscillospiraceae bacterium]|nr:metallophosphoesterase [Oscillospiraceae bacterium]
MKRPLKIIHAADLHLDSPFEVLGERAALRRSEQRELLQRIAELCREREADMLLLAGDLLDTGSAYAETFSALCSAFGSLDCPVFISPGNHDFYSPASPYAAGTLPENVHIFRGGWECVELAEKGVRLYGAAFT